MIVDRPPFRAWQFHQGFGKKGDEEIYVHVLEIKQRASGLPIWTIVERRGPFEHYAEAEANAPRDLKKFSSHPRIDNGDVAMCAEGIMTLAEESAWRLGAFYARGDLQTRKRGQLTMTYYLLYKERANSVWRSVRCLGRTLNDHNTVYGSSNEGDGNLFHGIVLKSRPRPYKEKAPLTPEEQEQQRRIKKLREKVDRYHDVKDALARWNRKLALAKTKVKQYTRRLRAMDRVRQKGAA